MPEYKGYTFSYSSNTPQYKPEINFKMGQTWSTYPKYAKNKKDFKCLFLTMIAT